ncbi:MAG TPA: UDP-glucose 4-epimerase GalE [Rhizomicrobium sp.]|jgi:UDP-glucose 4-epimerase
MTVLICGGAGYIGSHTVYALTDRGEQVVVLDNLSTGVAALVSEKATLVKGDIQDEALVAKLIADHGVDSVIHFAGSIIVPESVAQPLAYYKNNTAASRTLMEACVTGGVKHFIFSSTAAVYGMGSETALAEDAVKDPISPYARSKLMTEWMLEDASRAYPGFQHIVLRYFNVAGADARGRTGQSAPRATHLIKKACQVALGRAPHLDVFGTDYDTPDGTGVRDYIHVSDLADAHVLALDALKAGSQSRTYNCGYGRGLSVRQIVGAMEKVAGKKLAVREQPRRPGDAASVISDPSRLKSELAWTPRHEDLDAIIRSALEWERRANAW